MSSNVDKLTVLTRMALPLLELFKKENTTVRIEVHDDDFDFHLFDNEDEYLHFWCPVESNEKDWNAESGGNVFMHIRTFESMKEILWTMKEALEC